MRRSLRLALVKSKTLRRLGGISFGLAVGWFAAHGDAALGAEKSSDANLYAAKQGLSPDELLVFIEKMQAKPKSIQNRAGFAEALIEAADRILAANPEEGLKTKALLAKLGALHNDAARGNAESDKKMMELATQLQGDLNAKLAREAKFLLLEAKALNADKIAAEQLNDVIEELRGFFRGEAEAKTLSGEHLILARASERLIRKIPDETLASETRREFGELFSRSEDRDLKKFGRKLTGAASAGPTEWVGKTLELAGPTVEGTPFDWESYRGKIVLVDFWATWCGPCVGEIPNVKANYEKYAEQGFEVVGISLDSKREDLEKFLTENKIAWTNIFETEQEQGQPSPLASKYGVNAIPSTFLIDREGKVLAQNVRGEQLGAQLERIFSGKEVAPPGETPATSFMGQPLELTGKTAEGTAFDWSAYRGKYVLVDFWATWCGPCVGEIPNVKKCHEKFHARGFEVVGISLDQSRDDLLAFLKDESIPWTNLHSDEQTQGQLDPLAAKYGVNAIPATFLVDREGKVIAENLRGEALEAKLNELLPESPAGAEAGK